MSKKILGICAALVALAALAIPASASAATTLREGGVPLNASPEVKILATQHEESIFEAGGGTVVCTENTMTGSVHTNDHTNGITGTITHAAFRGTESETRCKSSLLGPTKVDIPALDNKTGDWCIKNVAGTDNFEVLGRGCTEAGNGTLTFTLTGSLTCTYTRSSGVEGHFTTTEAPATLTVTNNPEFTRESPSSFLCPANGKITKMAFTLFTDTEKEEPVSIDDV